MWLVRSIVIVIYDVRLGVILTIVVLERVV